MRAATPLAPLLAALAAGHLLGACGGGLYDATGVPVLQGGDVCGETQISCGGACAEPSATQCGAACEDCTATVTPPANGIAACLGAAAAGTCGYVCTGGFIKCATGCCGATALAAGDLHTCALLSSGEVACWGANGAGQLGDGTTEPRLAPKLVALDGPAVALGAGASHTCAVLQGGGVRCWGANGAAQVTGSAGPSALLPAGTPVAAGAIAVTGGAGHTCALVGGGAIRCWGTGAPGTPAQPVASGATTVVSGRDHACALVAGQVRCWGSNAKGQLGVVGATGVAVAIPSGIQLLAAGGDHACAATGTSRVTSPDDALRCWGDSAGAGWLLAEPQPTPAVPLKEPGRATVEYDVSMVAAGDRFACVMKKTEAVECLGANDRGQLGNAPAGAGETAAVPLPAVAPAPAPLATALAAGARHACAALSDRRLRCWGANDAGQLGDGTTVDPGLGILATPLGR